jgi:hypothetical protein
LRDCYIRLTVIAIRFQQKLNDINDPSAIRCHTGLKARVDGAISIDIVGEFSKAASTTLSSITL